MSKIRTRFALGFITIGAVGALIASPPAQADPVQDMLHDASLFCTWVYNDPTPRGVANAVAEFVNQGVPEQVAVDTITFAIANVCPQYGPLVAETARLVAPQQYV
ncbi:gp57 [Mycobacterium phage Barnyard]|uniref:DUF732 domain-containing protein n=1 Tax=Mycobacterium phage Barnyard TaxID=205880 RepID=Q856B5_9CAUD|nr:gp57 [Mycobacterium phage Barnyard]AAN02111.1 hypothetical protein PBI_BARNYARD_57 [Mycobacterium phage Barnyard]